MNDNKSPLVTAIAQYRALSEYRDQKYIELITQLNSKANNIIKDDLGSQFVSNCGRDLAGEVVRNLFNTSDYYITVDQLANRIIKFSYEEDYDPLKENGSNENIRKSVYNYKDNISSSLNEITNKIDSNQEQLFQNDRANDPLDIKGKKAYRNSQETANGELYDELTGNKGNSQTIIQNGKKINKSDLHADHIQAREAAKYNSRYIYPEGAEIIRTFWNSADNMQLIHASANTSKGDVRVCEVNGKIVYKNTKDSTYDPTTDITHKATPEQLANATISQWEKGNIDSPKIQKLIEQGYLVKDENGKVHVPKSVRVALEQNIRHSQNTESKIILENLNYKQVGKDALSMTKSSIGKILAGQIIYYAAPPLVFEVRCILQNKKITIEEALKQLSDAGKRICKYVSSHLGDIFKNVVANSIKKFIKSFMDFLINLVKATVKKMLKLVKNLLLSVVDATKIITTPNTTPAQKADAVFNLFGITITNFAIEILFEYIEKGLHIPEFLLMPLQILTSVICSNLVMLVLQKADLFDVRFGFKMNAIRDMFKNENEHYQYEMQEAIAYTETNVNDLIDIAKRDCYEIYTNLLEINAQEKSIRETLKSIDNMFCMNIDFESEWEKFKNYSMPVF